MRIAICAALLAVAAIAPAGAESATKVRAFQDLSLDGGSPGEFFVNVQFKDRNGNHRFTPRYAVGYRLQAALSCTPGGRSSLEIAGNAYAKYAYFKEKLSRGEFTHPFGSELPESTSLRGDLSGRVPEPLRRNGLPKHEARVDGAFGVDDWDPTPGVRENCVTSGSYSATPCKRKRAKRDQPRWYREWDVPVCSVDLADRAALPG
jgi:hypothetical protein